MRIKSIILLAVIIVAGIGVYLFSSNSKSNVLIGKGQISKVETMVQLCTIDFLNEVPVKDTIDNWELFGIQKQRGSVSFDIENLKVESGNDTVIIELPAEIIEINESTDDNSWQPVDSKDLRTLRIAKAPAELYTRLKQKSIENSKAQLYHNGVVARARKEGAQSLQALMEKVYRKPVKVVDPTPEGAHCDEYQ